MKRIVLFIIVVVTILYGLSSCVVKEQPTESNTPSITPSEEPPTESSTPSVIPEITYPVFDPPWYTTLEIGQEFRLIYDENRPRLYFGLGDTGFYIFREGNCFSTVSLEYDEEKGTRILTSVIVFNDKRELIYTLGSTPHKIDITALKEDLNCKFKSIAKKYGSPNGMIGSSGAGKIYITEDAYVVIFWITDEKVDEIQYIDMTDKGVLEYVDWFHRE